MKLSTFTVDVRFCLKPPATDGKATPQQKKHPYDCSGKPANVGMPVWLQGHSACWRLLGRFHPTVKDSSLQALMLGKLEGGALVEYFTYTTDFQKVGSAAFTKTSTQIGDVVVKIDVAFLAQHAQSGGEEELLVDVFFLINRNDAVGEIEPTLSLLLVADGQHRRGATESGDVACRLSCL